MYQVSSLCGRNVEKGEFLTFFPHRKKGKMNFYFVCKLPFFIVQIMQVYSSCSCFHFWATFVVMICYVINFVCDLVGALYCSFVFSHQAQGVGCVYRQMTEDVNKARAPYISPIMFRQIQALNIIFVRKDGVVGFV